MVDSEMSLSASYQITGMLLLLQNLHLGVTLGTSAFFTRKGATRFQSENPDSA